MKKNLFFAGMATIVAASQLLTACSTDDFNGQSSQNVQSGNTINLTSTLLTAKSTSDPQTTQLNTAVTVGAFGIASDAAITNGDNNPYTVEANGTLTAAAEMIWPAEGSASIYAYAPYQSDWTYDADNTFTIAADQTEDTGYLASDLVYGTPASNPVSQTETAIPLSFSHKLVKLNITIQQDASSTIDLSAASVTITNTLPTTTFNPSTGNIGEATGTATDIKAVSALGTATTVCAIIVPQQIAAGTKLVSIVADGKQLIAKLGTATTFVGGKSYNFTVNVGSTPEPVTEVTLKLGSTSVVNWDDEDMGAADADDKLYAEFGTPGGSASYDAATSTYTWNASTNNLMNCFTFSNGELANYTTLTFKFSDNSNVPVRINILYSDNTNNNTNSGYYSAGEKTITLSEVLSSGKTLADVTAIRFGGANGTGSCVIKASDMYLK